MSKEYLKGGRKEKIIEAIKECNIRRLKTNEAIVFIEKQTGKKISDRTYRRYKHEMEESINARYGDMAKSEFITEHVQRVDTLKKIEGEYWENYESTNSVPVRKAILDSIAKIQLMYTTYYNGERIMKRVARWLDDGLEKIETHQQLIKKQPFKDYANVPSSSEVGQKSMSELAA